VIQISHSDAAEAAAGRKHASCYLDGHYFGNPFILHDVKRRALSLASRGFGEPRFWRERVSRAGTTRCGLGPQLSAPHVAAASLLVLGIARYLLFGDRVNVVEFFQVDACHTGAVASLSAFETPCVRGGKRMRASPFDAMRRRTDSSRPLARCACWVTCPSALRSAHRNQTRENGHGGTALGGMAGGVSPGRPIPRHLAHRHKDILNFARARGCGLRRCGVARRMRRAVHCRPRQWAARRGPQRPSRASTVAAVPRASFPPLQCARRSHPAAGLSSEVRVHKPL